MKQRTLSPTMESPRKVKSMFLRWWDLPNAAMSLSVVDANGTEEATLGERIRGYESVAWRIVEVANSSS